MASYNRVIMMGNLTRDPEYKQLSSGQAVCRLGLASNRQFKNRQSGETVQEVCFIDVDVWGQQAESCRQFLQKGRAVLVEGRLKLDSWQDEGGQRRSKHSIVADRVTFLSSSPTAEVGSEADADFSVENNFSSAGSQANQYSAATKVTSSESEKPKSEQAPRAPRKPKASFAQSETQETTASGELPFKDEEPFEDDLPF